MNSRITFISGKASAHARNVVQAQLRSGLAVERAGAECDLMDPCGNSRRVAARKARTAFVAACLADNAATRAARVAQHYAAVLV